MAGDSMNVVTLLDAKRAPVGSTVTCRNAAGMP